MNVTDYPSTLREALSRAPDSLWAHKDFALLGWGESMNIDPGAGADRFDRALRQLRATEAPLALAGFTFDENTPGSVVIVPEVLMRVDPGGTRFLIGSEADLPSTSSTEPLPDGQLHDPGPEQWREDVREALEAIKRHEVEKVVLSRVLETRFEDDVPARSILANLVAGEPDSHTFLLDHLVGSSPELLVSLAAGEVRSISLAGSADIKDLGGRGALDTEKMANEHALAADSVEDALTPFCSRLDRSASRVATYGDIQHLCTSFEGAAPAGTLVTDLLSALHPTAAVAGTPTKSALELIRELERHDRGRYAGPVGWLDRSGDGEFAIALRCGLIDGSTVSLFTGAGLVGGSDPDLEYEETRIKLRPMLGALGLS